MAASIYRADKVLKGRNLATVIESWKDAGINLEMAIKVTFYCKKEPCESDEK